MISVREAVVEDAKILVDFQARLAFETEKILLDKSVVEKGVLALFSDPSKGVYSLAVDGDTPVGCYLITYEWSDWRNGMVWWLQSVYVIESYRKQKVFSTMYQHIKRSIESDPSVLGLRLYVDKSNNGAQLVYKSIGMNGDHYTVFEWMK